MGAEVTVGVRGERRTPTATSAPRERRPRPERSRTDRGAGAKPPKQDGVTYRHPVRVRYGECDPPVLETIIQTHLIGGKVATEHAFASHRLETE